MMKSALLVLLCIGGATRLFAEEPKPVNVPAGDLIGALKTFTKQTGVEVVYLSDRLLGLKTEGVKGTLLPQDALTRILRGTPLALKVDPTGAVLITLPEEDLNSRVPTESSRDSEGDSSVLHLVQSSAAASTQAAAPSQQAQGSSTASDDDKIEEIVVTATKRSERVQDVPISIGVVGANDIDQRGLVGSADYLRGMPGVNQTEIGYGGQAIIIRGLETTNSFLNFSGGTTVGSYFGETPTTNSAGLLGSSVDIKLVDIDRVEVLRGPQGTAFGSSSMGGTVRIIPVAPALDGFEAKVEAGYSMSSGTGGDNYNVQGIGNIPLSKDRLALRGVVYKFSDSGFYSNTSASDPGLQSSFVIPYSVQDFVKDEDEVGALDVTGGRLSLLFKATEKLNVTLNYLNQKAETDGYPVATNGGFVQALSQVAPEHVYRGQHFGINDNDIEVFNAVLEYDFGWADLLATYSRIDGNSDHALIYPVFGVNAPISFHQFSPHDEDVGELRLVSKFDGPVNFLAGVYADKQYDEYHVDWIYYGDPATNTFSNPPARDLLDYVDRRDLEQQAVFAEVSWDILPRLTLTGGVRAYDYDRRTRINQTGPLLAGAVVATDDQTDDSGTTFRGNFSFKPTEDSLLYASWSEGFRLGRPQPPLPASVCDSDSDGLIDGTNASIGSTGSVASDDVTSYEIGWKAAFLERRMTLDAAVFRMDWNNIPVQINPPCGYSYTTNAGKGRSQGVEVQANLRLTPKFIVNAGGSWIDAEITTDVPAQGFESGDPLPGTPKESANLGLQYLFNVAGRDAYVRADSIYVGRFWGDIPQSETQVAGDYIRLDGAGRITFGNLAFDLYVHNLTDEDAYSSRGVGAGLLYGYRLRPRTVGFQLSYDF